MASTDRSSELRALMKSKASSFTTHSTSGPAAASTAAKDAMALAREKARLLKQMKAQQALHAGSSHSSSRIVTHLSTGRLPSEATAELGTSADVGPSKAVKTVRLSSITSSTDAHQDKLTLVASSATATTSAVTSSSYSHSNSISAAEAVGVFAYEDVDEDETTFNTNRQDRYITAMTSSQQIPPHAASSVLLPAAAASSSSSSDGGGGGGTSGGFPAGFFDDPEEALRAQGIRPEVAQMQRQEREAGESDALASFFGEVEEVVRAVDEGEFPDEDEDNAFNDVMASGAKVPVVSAAASGLVGEAGPLLDEDAMVHLAYAAKAANLLSQSERALEALRRTRLSVHSRAGEAGAMDGVPSREGGGGLTGMAVGSVGSDGTASTSEAAEVFRDVDAVLSERIRASVHSDEDGIDDDNMNRDDNGDGGLGARSRGRVGGAAIGVSDMVAILLKRQRDTAPRSTMPEAQQQGVRAILGASSSSDGGSGGGHKRLRRDDGAAGNNEDTGDQASVSINSDREADNSSYSDEEDEYVPFDCTDIFSSGI